ncbi:hypothetical protein J2X32_003795 [Rheinheimera pacifica]|uniref:DUF4124 domain-containing protein n=1 Tax=Rheinheimera pacifica TaxID=173990 RepID=UPI000CAB7E94|nr:DUF4124 domain-containing protein [Rheinheimera pacifica]MDR6985138.1 hypothetical protein [Rheinheimera pacifica]PKM17937.1 MAG: DUF4124 domain-containing protein [Gammaproteobacteria bacterium HGW-Gammaproteobacteria-15]
MTIMIRLYLLLASLLVAPYVSAEVYKCTAANGDVVFQGEPCRSGSEVKVDIRFGEQQVVDINQLISGSWCEIGTSVVADGTVTLDNAMRKTWIFSERQMVQHISQGQRQDTFKYAIRQTPGSFVIDHPAFGSGQVSWQVRKLTDEQLVISAYGGFTHLSPGNCEVKVARAQN